jgi:hypothetical protein
MNVAWINIVTGFNLLFLEFYKFRRLIFTAVIMSILIPSQSTPHNGALISPSPRPPCTQIV